MTTIETIDVRPSHSMPSDSILELPGGIRFHRDEGRDHRLNAISMYGFASPQGNFQTFSTASLGNLLAAGAKLYREVTVEYETVEVKLDLTDRLNGLESFEAYKGYQNKIQINADLHPELEGATTDDVEVIVRRKVRKGAADQALAPKEVLPC